MLLHIVGFWTPLFKKRRPEYFDFWCCKRDDISHTEKKCRYLELFWPVFSCIPTKSGEMLCISPYSGRMQENTDQNNSEYGHFSRSVRVQCFETFVQKTICWCTSNFIIFNFLRLFDVPYPASYKFNIFKLVTRNSTVYSSRIYLGVYKGGMQRNATRLFVLNSWVFSFPFTNQFKNTELLRFDIV